MTTDFKDYYATLGVDRNASAEEIKKAFRKLARLYHPDLSKDKSSSDAKFKAINEANEVLRDPVKRKKYDQLGANWDQTQGAPQNPYHSQETPEQEFHFDGTGFSDFFEQYFSSGGFNQHGQTHTRASQVYRGNDIEGDILITLDEAMTGALRSVSLQTLNRQTGQTKTRNFKVRIPPGATDGRRIRVPGHGEQGFGGGPSGDLFLRVRHAAHPDFTSLNTDIFHELDIAPWEAVLGATVTVPTLDGSIRMRVPPNSENGQRLRVRGRGLPKEKKGSRGDFFVILQVQLPQNLSSNERALWEQLREGSSFPRRQKQNERSTTP
ncbi:MAG: J domain-containing protein [Opitutales bacterium]|nr:J domain-containing protein [Opitutales bacterium]MCH8541634.1 J domain-containing protein [Opitutales bacterium]